MKPEYNLTGNGLDRTTRNALVSRFGAFIVAALFALIAPAALPSEAASPVRLSDLVTQLKPGVFSIVAITEDGETGIIGTAFRYGKRDLLVSNAHVFMYGAYSGSSRKIALAVKNSDGVIDSDIRVVAWDAQKDMIIFRAPSMSARPLERGSVESVRAGDVVLAIGNALGLEYSISNGIVSGIRDFGDGQRLMQHTAPVSPGNSGGPLFDERGRVIGVNTLASWFGQNVNFSIPIDVVDAFMTLHLDDPEAPFAEMSYQMRSVYIVPEKPNPGDSFVLHYRASRLDPDSTPFLHWGYDGWNAPPEANVPAASRNVEGIWESPMNMIESGHWSIEIKTDTNWEVVNFVFTDGVSWDNNAGRDYRIDLVEEQTHWITGVTWRPRKPKAGSRLMICYPADGADQFLKPAELALHWGVNGWKTVPESMRPIGSRIVDGTVRSPFAKTEYGYYAASFVVAEGVRSIEFTVTDGEVWDNNGGYDFRIKIESAETGAVDARDITDKPTVAERHAVQQRTDERTTVEPGRVRFTYFNRRASSVCVAGTFNGWKPDAGAMEQKDGLWTRVVVVKPGRYEYKFVVDGDRWIHDPGNSERIVDDYGGGFKSVIVVPADTVATSAPTTVTAAPRISGSPDHLFRITKPDATSVAVAGTFNGWSLTAHRLAKQEDGSWMLRLTLKPGRHEYKFVIDGAVWIVDPENAVSEPDKFGGFNSVLMIEAPTDNSGAVVSENITAEIPGGVKFVYSDATIRSVSVAGSFNGWNKTMYPMRYDGKVWSVFVPLNPGTYHYKFVINGDGWVVDPGNDGKVDDNFGGVNSVIVVTGNPAGAGSGATNRTPIERIRNYLSSVSTVASSDRYGMSTTLRIGPRLWAYLSSRLENPLPENLDGGAAGGRVLRSDDIARLCGATVFKDLLAAYGGGEIRTASVADSSRFADPSVLPAEISVYASALRGHELFLIVEKNAVIHLEILP